MERMQEWKERGDAAVKYKNNTVKGTRRGQKWPESVRVACMAALLFENNLSAVAARYGVPESTLRTWQTKARQMQDEEKQSIFDKARSDAVRKVAVQAAQSTVLAEELLHRKLERGLSNDEKMQDIVSRLEALGPSSDAEDPKTELERKQLQHTVTVYRGVTPYNAKNIRALSWTLDRKTADWFAHRFGEEGTVYEAQIRKEHILALFTGRNESEVIVDPRHLEQIMESPEPEFDMQMT